MPTNSCSSWGFESRRHVTAHPAAPWTLQQFREALPGDHAYRWVLHDRGRICSKDLDQAVEAMGVRVLPTLVRAPQANAYCRRMVRMTRRECVDFLIRFFAGGEARPDGRTEYLTLHLALVRRDFQRTV